MHVSTPYSCIFPGVSCKNHDFSPVTRWAKKSPASCSSGRFASCSAGIDAFRFCWCVLWCECMKQPLWSHIRHLQIILHSRFKCSSPQAPISRWRLCSPLSNPTRLPYLLLYEMLLVVSYWKFGRGLQCKGFQRVVVCTPLECFVKVHRHHVMIDLTALYHLLQ